MFKRNHSEDSDKSQKLFSKGPSCSLQYDYNNYLQFNQNGTNTSANEQYLVNKHDFYRNPEIFSDDQQGTGDSQNKSISLENNWAGEYWLKPNDIPASTQMSRSGKCKVKKPNNSVEENLKKMLAQPAEMSKGKRLLEKMGWKGGGLGKDEDGIVDPIAPKATYANKTIGLGHLTENKHGRNQNVRGNKARKNCIIENMGWKGIGMGEDGKVDPLALEATQATQPTGLDQRILLANLLEDEYAPKLNGKNKNKKKIKQLNNKCEEAQLIEADIQFKNNVRSKILLRILEFVKDNSKTELPFEKMSRAARKSIHNLVENVRDCDNPEDLENDNDKETFAQILLYNNYILKTESNGEGAKRRLCLYKEAPENVYLITPDYLREEIEENKTDSKKDITIDTGNSVTITTNETEVATDKVHTNDVNKTKIDSCDRCKADNGGNDLKNEMDIDIIIDKRQDGYENELHKIENHYNVEKEKCLEKIIEYFREFVDDFVYKEFRFLGDFNNYENDAIKLFFDICLKMPVECEGKSDLIQILNNISYTFNIEEDSNGSLIINKLQDEFLSELQY